jgi:putative ABC transport system permease protein
MPLALRLALREMRGDLRSALAGFRIFLACLALGVAGIAGVGSVAAALQAGLAANAGKLLGGDLEFALPQRDPPAAALAWIEARGRVSTIRTLRGMARKLDGTAPQLVAVKAVDSAYPLYGTVALDGAASLSDALAMRDRLPGIAAAPALIDRLGLRLGDRLRLGTGVFVLRARLLSEPDQAGLFEIGQPVLISFAGLKASGLDLPGTLSTHAVRLRLDRPETAKAMLAAAGAAFPGLDWQAREAQSASPLLSGFIDQAQTMLVLVGLAALLLGGIGVAQAIAAHLDRRRATIAVLKCVGASSRLIMAVYLLEILTLALLGIAAGLALGAAAPWLLATALGDRLPIPLGLGLYPRPLAFAAGCGVLVAVAGLFWSLAGIRAIAAAAQLRGVLAPSPAWRDRFGALVPLAILAALVPWASGAPKLAAETGGGIMVALLLFLALGRGMVQLARGVASLTAGRTPLALRLGLAALYRPGAATPAAVLALGLGLSVLIAVSAIDTNLEHLLHDALPARAPSLFFIDLQPDQTEPFAALAKATPGIDDLAIVPSLRTRVVRLNGRSLDAVAMDAGTRRLVDGDRGLTYAGRLPAGSTVVTGRWWPADYRGPPLLSLDADLAHDLHLAIGDTMTLNVAGREITARIANTRRINWSSLGINFFIVMAPGTLEPAPQTHIATIHAETPAAEERFEAAVADRFANVSTIPIAAALAKVAAILNGLVLGVRSVAILLLAAGLLVLAGIEAAARERRVADAGLLQVLGAGRGLLLRAYLVEYGLLGLAAGLVATAAGTLGAWAMVTQAMQIPWRLPWLAASVIPLAAIPLVMLIGFAGTWRTLGTATGRVRR